MATSITNTSITTNDLIVDSADNLLKVDHATNRVGVGTSSPSNLLTLKADSTEETMLVLQNNSAVDIGSLSIHPSNGLVLSQSVAGSSVHVMTHDGNEDINLDSDGFIQIEVAGSELMRLNSTGVGIDTDNPLSIFHVGSGSDANVPITLAPATGGNIEFRNTSSTGTFTFTNANGSNEHIRIDSSGNVGIGESSPDRQLHITDASEVNLKLEAGSDIAEIRLKDSDNALTVHLDNNERMGLKANEVNWTNSTAGFYNKIWGPSSGDIASGYLTYRGSTLRGGFYTNPTHGLTVISEVDMSFRANNANRMHINTDGIVTTPNQPSFQASKSGSSWTVTAGSIFIFNNTEHNIGGHYNTSNGRFTAPVAGTYQFSFHTIYTGNSGNDWISIRRNGARISGGDYHFSTTPGGQWDTIGGSLNLYLSSGDYVSMYAGTEHVYHGGTWSNFGGHLVG